MKFYIAIAGNIGAGKSSLAELLSARLGWQPFYEAASENPYLEDFYRDMRRWAFHSQVCFLARRLAYHQQLLDHPDSVIQDRTVYEDAQVFATNLYQQGMMEERDFRTYCEVYGALLALLPPPDLVIYLRAGLPTLRRRIVARGREYEQGMPDEYLEQLNQLYEAWIDQFNLCPVLTVPADDLDFVHEDAHLNVIIQRVLDRLHGREELILPPAP